MFGEPRLHGAQMERLEVLVEECAEVTIPAMKMMRFGVDDRTLNNLTREAAHVYAVLEWLLLNGDIQFDAFERYRVEKFNKLPAFTYYDHKYPERS